MIGQHPELFWGVIASMYIGNFYPSRSQPSPCSSFCEYSEDSQKGATASRHPFLHDRDVYSE